MDISKFNPGMELQERNHLSVSRTRKEPDVVCQMPKQFIFSDNLPGWANTEVWNYTTRRMNAEFVMCRMELREGGCTQEPVCNGYENFFYVLSGRVHMLIGSEAHTMDQAGYCWIPPEVAFEIKQAGEEPAQLLWVKKVYKPLETAAMPSAVVGNADKLEAEGNTAEYIKKCLPADKDMGFDLSIDLLIYYPGVTSEQTEMHMSAHGMYVLEGRGDVVVNNQHYETHENDYFYIAPCAPHYIAAYAPKPLCILVLEDVNRDFAL